MADKMQAVQAHEYGGPEVLSLEEIPCPQPNPDQVLIQVKAAGVNPADWKYRAGMYKQMMPLTFPWTPGLEASGVVETVGSNVTNFRKGQEVYGVVTGGYAEYALALAKDIQPKPAGLNFDEAASVPIGALTAWGAVDAAQLQKGQHVLVHGGAGGVGSYVVQLAHLKGAHVAATASADNLDFMRSLGAETVIDYNAAPFETVVHGLDVVIDTVGGDLAERSYKVLRPDGIYVTVVGRPPEDAGKAEGVRVGRAGRTPSETLRQISELLESKQLRPVVGKIFLLGEVQEAHDLSEKGHGRGRIILQNL